MGIAGGIIQIIVLLLPVILAAVASSNTPQAKQENTNEKLDKAVVTGDTDTINVFLHDRLSNSTGSNLFGPAGKI